MPNVKTNKEQMQEVYLMWSHGGKNRQEIHSQLIREFGRRAVSISTLNRWIKEYEQLTLEDSIQDVPFQWRFLDRYGIPWQEGKLASYLDNEYFELTGKRPSGRIIKWAWRNWYLSEGANLTPHDDIAFFWKILIEKSNTDAEWERSSFLAHKLNWKTWQQGSDRIWISKKKMA